MLGSLLKDIAESATLQLVERQQDGSSSTCNGTQLIARHQEWSRYLGMLEMPRGTPLLVPMRSSLDSVAIILAAWGLGLMPILVKPTAPIAYIEALLKRLPSSILLLDAVSLRLLSIEGRSCEGSPSSRFIASVFEGRTGHHQHTQFPAGGNVGILTTGSTGEPKVVINSLERVALNASLHAKAIGLSPDDTVGLSLPLSFSYGFVAGLLATLIVGARGILLDPEQTDIGRALVQHEVTVAMGTPYTARRFLPSGALGRVRVLTIGGDILHVTLAREILDENPGLKLYATYGLSEAGPRVATCHVTHSLISNLGAIPLGKPLGGVTLRLHDHDFHSGVGELLVRSPTTMLGYLHDPAATTQTFLPESGELRTGDQFAERDGELFFAGRKKRVICRAGEKIYPALVERQILSMGQVQDALVTAAPHSEYGEVPEAYIVPGGAFSLRDLERYLRRTLPRSHVPLAWNIVDEMPAGIRK